MRFVPGFEPLPFRPPGRRRHCALLGWGVSAALFLAAILPGSFLQEAPPAAGPAGSPAAAGVDCPQSPMGQCDEADGLTQDVQEAGRQGQPASSSPAAACAANAGAVSAAGRPARIASCGRGASRPFHLLI